MKMPPAFSSFMLVAFKGIMFFFWTTGSPGLNRDQNAGSPKPGTVTLHQRCRPCLPGSPGVSNLCCIKQKRAGRIGGEVQDYSSSPKSR